MASEDVKKKIKDSTDIVALIGETIPLRRAGKLFKGLSPFSKEKSPSFFVNPEKQSFYCYSTNQGGDVIDFIRITRAFSYIEALRFLAEKSNIPLVEENKTPEQIAKDKKEEEERKLLLKLNRFAAHFFQEQFEGSVGAVAREYAQRRGLTKDTLLNFAIGYAPDAWTGMRDYLMRIKAPLVKAHELGLLRTKGGEKPKEDGSNLFDTFRNRLIFPIRDTHGEVVAFGGRWLGSESADAPKYLNSPESIVYQKSRTLYNLDRARKAIRDKESVVLVEGYMDCIALDQAGFGNAVANCGTALTAQHARILKQLSARIICLYDSDTAGQRATERNMEIFLESEGFPLLGAHVPDGKDPDDFLKAHPSDGVAKMEELLKNAPAVLDSWINKELANTPDTMQAKTAALDKITNKLALLSDDLWIEARLSDLTKRLGIEPVIADRAMQRHRKNFRGIAQPGSRPSPGAQSVPVKSASLAQKSKQIQGSSGKRTFGFEQKFLTDFLTYPDWIPALRKIHASDPGAILPFVGDQEIFHALTIMLAPLDEGESERDRILRLQEEVRTKDLLRNIVAEAMTKSDDSLPAKDLAAALEKLREEAKRKKVELLKQKIREADARGDQVDSENYLRELETLQRQRIGS